MADTNHITPRCPSDAATLAAILLKASIVGLDRGTAAATITRKSVLAGGVAAAIEYA